MKTASILRSIALLPLLAACGSSTDGAPDDPSAAGAMTGGTNATQNQYPATVMLVADSVVCSATKVAPALFLTSADCVTDGTTVRPDFADGAKIRLSTGASVQSVADVQEVTIATAILHDSWASFCDGCTKDQFREKYNNALKSSDDGLPIPLALLRVTEDTSTIPVATVSGTWVEGKTPVTLVAFAIKQQVNLVAERRLMTTMVMDKTMYDNDVYFHADPKDESLQPGDTGGAVYGANNVLVGVIDRQVNLMGLSFDIFATRVSKRSYVMSWFKWDVGGWLADQGVPVQ